MDAISQTTFSKAFSWVKMYEFRLKKSLKFVPKGPINNIPALVQIMAWRRPCDKPLSEAMMVNLPTHICVSRPQWVKEVQPLQSNLSDVSRHDNSLPSLKKICEELLSLRAFTNALHGSCRECWWEYGKHFIKNLILKIIPPKWLMFHIVV